MSKAPRLPARQPEKDPVPVTITPAPTPNPSWTLFIQGIIATALTAFLAFIQMSGQARMLEAANEAKRLAEEAARNARESVIKTEESGLERDRKLAVIEKVGDATHSLVNSGALKEAKRYAKTARALSVIKPEDPDFKRDAELAEKAVAEHMDADAKLEARTLKEKIESEDRKEKRDDRKDAKGSTDK